MGGRGAASGKIGKGFFFQTADGEISQAIDLKSISNAQAEEMGIDAISKNAFKSATKEITSDTWVVSSNPVELYRQHKVLSANKVKAIQKKGYVGREQRRINQATKDRITWNRKNNIPSDTRMARTGFDVPTVMKNRQGQRQLSKEARREGLTGAYVTAYGRKKDITGDIAWSKQYGGSTRQQQRQLNAVNRQLKGIEREAKKHGIKNYIPDWL